jgi:hypothetical protein
MGGSQGGFGKRKCDDGETMLMKNVMRLMRIESRMFAESLKTSVSQICFVATPVLSGFPLTKQKLFSHPETLLLQLPHVLINFTLKKPIKTHKMIVKSSNVKFQGPFQQVSIPIRVKTTTFSIMHA